MTLSFAQSICILAKAFCSLLSPTSKKAFVKLKEERKDKAYLFQIFCKAKDRTQRVNKSYNYDREVHVCGYVVDGVKSEDQDAPCFSLSILTILGIAKRFIFAWTFMYPFFFIGLHVPSFFFQYIAHAFIGENYWGETSWSMEHKRGMNEWMVWKC